MKHKIDTKYPHTALTNCGLVVGLEHATEVDEEVDCSKCKRLEHRLDEPDTLEDE